VSERIPGLLGDVARLPLVVMLFTLRQMVETAERWTPALVTPAAGAPPRYAQRNHPAAPTASPVFDRKEETNVADIHLNDDDVKLVQYGIVSIERRKEKLLAVPKFHLEKGRTTSEAFASARIAELVRNEPATVEGLDLDDLRVYHEVLARWPKSDLKFEEKSLEYEEEKLDVLRELARRA
jgi:hypothetical protein